MPRRLCLLILLLLTALSGTCPAATLYVAHNGDGSAPNADDARTACPTIRSALALAHKGDTIELAPGSYSETVIIPDGVTLRGKDPRPTLTAKDDIPVRLGSDTAIENIHIIGVRGETVVMAPYRRSNVTVRNCIIEGGRTGISCGRATGVSIINCIIRRNAEAGLDLDAGEGPTCRIVACTIYRNGRHGVILRGGGWSVENNTIAVNAGDGLNIDRTSPSVLNNIIALNSRYGVYEGPLNSHPQLRFNVLHGNPAGAYRQTTRGLPADVARLNSLRDGCRSNLDAEPDFVCLIPGMEDLHPLPGSPVLAAGRRGARTGALDVAPPRPAPPKPWRVTAVGGLTLVPREAAWCGLPNRQVLRLGVARGETVSFQIAGIPLVPGVGTWSVKLPLLVSAGGEKLLGIGIRHVGYLRRTHTGGDGQLDRWLIAKGGNRWQPDVLLDSAPAARPGMVQCAWISISVAPTAVPGDYLGTATAKAPNAGEQSVEVRLHVYDFSPPARHSITAAMDYSMASLRDEYGDAADSALEWLCDDMLSHRMSPLMYLDPASPDFEKRARRHVNHGAPLFAVSCGEMVAGWPRAPDALREHLPPYRTVAQRLEKLGLLDHACIRPWTRTAMTDKNVAAVSAMLREAYPRLKQLIVADSAFDPVRFPIDAQAGDIWSAEPLALFRHGAIEACRGNGKEVWMALVDFDRRRPGLTLDDDPIDWVISPWLAWAHGIGGLFQWNANAWRTRSSPVGLMRHVDTGAEAPRTMGRANLYGVLYYPGANHPVPSVRLEVFRSGLQDYERLKLLVECVKRAEAAGANAEAAADGMRLLGQAKKLASHPSRFARDPGKLLELREAVAHCIEKLQRK